jgi:hypothetical protein
MRTLTRTLLAPALVLAFSAPASAATHPHLLFGAADVSKFQAEAASTHADIYKALKAGADEFLTTSIASDGTVSWANQSQPDFNLGDLRDIGYALVVWSFVRQRDGKSPQNQLMEQGASDEAETYSWFPEREGSIPFHGSSDDFAYAIGDGAHLYDASLGLTRWDRHALFVDRKWVILRDVVEASASHSYAWFCHFMEGAQQDGAWIRGDAGGGHGLGVAVVAPAPWKLDVAPQSPPNIEHLNPSGHVYAAVVTPLAPTANTTFLTALLPTELAAWDGRPNVTALDASAPDAGMVLDDGTHHVVALFSRLASDDTHVGGYHVAGQAGVAEYEVQAPTRALLLAGSVLEDTQRPLIKLAGSSTLFEADGLEADTLSLSGDLVGMATIDAPNAAQLARQRLGHRVARDGRCVARPTTPDAVARGSRRFTRRNLHEHSCTLHALRSRRDSRPGGSLHRWLQRREAGLHRGPGRSRLDLVDVACLVEQWHRAGWITFGELERGHGGERRRSLREQQQQQ